MTPAAELRAAAAKIRDHSVRTFRTLAYRKVEWRDAVKDVGGRGNPNVWTDYAATMDPAASIFLANMLEGVADAWEALDRHNTQTTAGQEHPDEPETYWLEARRFAEVVLNLGRARAEFEASATQPLPDRAEADLYLPNLAEVAAQPDATTKAGA